jgi:hypothetical protein
MSIESADAELASVDTTESADTEAPALSLEDELSATWDKAQEDTDTADEASSTPRVRGPDGKFAKSGDDNESAGQPSDEGPDTGAETLAVDAPAHWPADVVEKFNSLPAEAHDFKEFVVQREREQDEAIHRVGQEVLSVEQAVMHYEPFDQVTQAFHDDIARRGIHPAEAFHYLLNAQRTLDHNPLGGLVQIGRSYGIDLVPLLQAHGIQVPQPQQAHPIEPYVAALQSELQQIKGKLTAQEQQQYQAEEQRLNSAIADFSKDKPYFDEVRQDMAALLSGGRAKDLASAYDMAIHANPQVRARIQQDARKAEETKQKAKAEAARKSTAVNVRSGTPGSSNPKTMDDTLNEIARRHYG